MIAKLGVLVAALGAVAFVARLLSSERRRVEKKLSETARNDAAQAPTLQRDPQTGKYRAGPKPGPDA